MCVQLYISLISPAAMQFSPLLKKKTCKLCKVQWKPDEIVLILTYQSHCLVQVSISNEDLPQAPMTLSLHCSLQHCGGSGWLLDLLAVNSPVYYRLPYFSGASETHFTHQQVFWQHLASDCSRTGNDIDDFFGDTSMNRQLSKLQSCQQSNLHSNI